MKKLFALVAAVVLITACFSACNKYDEDKILGLTSAEVIEKYGDFDRKQGIEEDGLYRNCACGYLVSKSKNFFDGVVVPKYFMISFDEFGIAVCCVYEEVV